MEKNCLPGDSRRQEIWDALAEIGINTEEELMAAFNEPFDISMFTAPMSKKKEEDKSA